MGGDPARTRAHTVISESAETVWLVILFLLYTKHLGLRAADVHVRGLFSGALVSVLVYPFKQQMQVKPRAQTKPRLRSHRTEFSSFFCLKAKHKSYLFGAGGRTNPMFSHQT